jgi:hypothetical protein
MFISSNAWIFSSVQTLNNLLGVLLTSVPLPFLAVKYPSFWDKFWNLAEKYLAILCNSFSSCESYFVSEAELTSFKASFKASLKSFPSILVIP